MWVAEGCMLCSGQPMHIPLSLQVEKAGGVVNWNMYHKHQTLVLKSCMVGLWQPPMRLGMLRVLMPTNILGDVACISEDCQ